MRSYPIWINLAIYQMIWFVAVLGRDQLLPVLLVLLILHVVLCQDRRKETLVVAGCAAIGIGVDSLLAISGFFVFTPDPVVLPIPLWLVAIWLGFAGTLRHGMLYFVNRPALALFVAAIGAPLTYLAAGRLGAVTYSLGDLKSALILGMLWIPLMGVFIVITNVVSKNSTLAQAFAPPTNH